jgi:hypothetical protein
MAESGQGFVKYGATVSAKAILTWRDVSGGSRQEGHAKRVTHFLLGIPQ